MQGVREGSEEYAVLLEGNRNLGELERALAEAEMWFWLKVLRGICEMC